MDRLEPLAEKGCADHQSENWHQKRKSVRPNERDSLQHLEPESDRSRRFEMFTQEDVCENRGDDGLRVRDDGRESRRNELGRVEHAEETHACRPEPVRALLGQQLTSLGNPRLRLGEIDTASDGSITAEIVTVDDSLVQKLGYNRYPGLVRQIAE